MTVYIMKRTINILGFDKLMEKLHAWKPEYKGDWLYPKKLTKQKLLYERCFLKRKWRREKSLFL
jgi:hypothetical protein